MQVAGGSDEDEEVVKVVRDIRSWPVGSATADADADAAGEGQGRGVEDTDSHSGAAKPASMAVLRKYGSARIAKPAAATEEEGEAMDLDADSVAASAAVQSEEQVCTGDWQD